MLMERLEKEITSKLGGSICRSVSKRNLSGKKRRRESQKEDPTLGSGATKTKANENVDDEKVDVPMGTAESVVRSGFIVGEYASLH